MPQAGSEICSSFNSKDSERPMSLKNFFRKCLECQITSLNTSCLFFSRDFHFSSWNADGALVWKHFTSWQVSKC